MVSVLYRHSQDLRHLSPQNMISLKGFETTTREIGLVIYLSMKQITEDFLGGESPTLTPNHLLFGQKLQIKDIADHSSDHSPQRHMTQTERT